MWLNNDVIADHVEAWIQANVFGHAQENPALAAQMVEVWSTFARTGVPGAEGLPQWEPYHREGGATMLLENQSRLVHPHD